jgi:uncharacterized membrane protein YkvA (DUF1232 family)
MIERWRRWARDLKIQAAILRLAAGHPATPWYAKAMAAFVVGYALSPIDLIPDFIPVLGYLDDLVILPLGVWLTLKLVPPEVWAECRRQAERETGGEGRRPWMAAAVIVGLWLLAAYFAGRAVLPLIGG